jgi:peptide subunit release factor 1 (eRF1)
LLPTEVTWPSSFTSLTIDPIEERIVDSSDELTDQIVSQYNNITEEEEEEETSDKVTQISVFEAITALNVTALDHLIVPEYLRSVHFYLPFFPFLPYLVCSLS